MPKMILKEIIKSNTINSGISLIYASIIQTRNSSLTRLVVKIN